MALPINHLHLHVRDLGRSVAFYRDLFGATVKAQFGPELAFLSDGRGLDLALQQDAAPGVLPGWFHLGVRLKSAQDVHALVDRASRLTRVTSPPTEKHPGYVTAVFLDPDGYPFEVYWDQTLAEADDPSL